MHPSGPVEDNDNGNNQNVDTAITRLADEAKQMLHLQQKPILDVTSAFTAASSFLVPGELIKDEFFTLFEAVGALEITDSKMDSGHVPPGDSFEADFDPCAGLEADQVLWIMDQVLCLEIAWHQGASLSQTILTSLHIDRLISPYNHHPYTFTFGYDDHAGSVREQVLVHKVLRAYCIAVVKCCELVLHWIKSQTYFEEEDFVTYLYGRDLLQGLTIDDSTMLLEEAQDLLSELSLPEDLQHALVARLQFRNSYLASLSSEGGSWTTQLTEKIQRIDDTHNLSREESSAFSEKVQRQLATSTPPRQMVKVVWVEAMKQWRQFLSDMIELCSLISSFQILKPPHCLQRAMWSFVNRVPQPGCFARAKMQGVIFDGHLAADEMSHYELLINDMRELVLAGDPIADPASFEVELPSDPRHISSRVLEEFIEKALPEYLNVYRMICQNRCRMRRTFSQSIAILDALEDEAMKCDERLREAISRPSISESVDLRHTLKPLTNWTKYYKYNMVAWTIQLGFETDIYLPDELGSMYWFLARLSQARCDLIDAIDHTHTERMRYLETLADEASLAECLVSRMWNLSLKTGYELTRTLATALWCLYTALTTTKIIRTPPRDFAQSKLLHELRFKPFLNLINDPIPSFTDFEQAKVHQGMIAELCSEIDIHVKQAKRMIAELKSMSSETAKYVGTEAMWSQENKQMETTCVAIVVAVSQLRRIADKHGKSNIIIAGNEDLSRFIECDIPPLGPKRYHSWWVVPQLKERSS